MWKGTPFTSKNVGEYVGFIYMITNTLDGRSYIGKKNFWAKQTRAPLKGKKRKRRSYVESNWQQYWGSSEEVQLDVARLGHKNFKRAILHLCTSKGEMNYMEMKEQIMRDVLLKPKEYYNSFVGGKIHRKHLLG